ncbi:MDR family MFS transporter [Nocardioides mesophilus]|uniref:MFS transporter n=1 Tax=Nocardioides mesophilus TaxID=433659 RepID=A0A7G9R7R8_9ACTN|nr:MDR family MFS transporter [Nocardioides mesophilus]QNN51643.1 MFS transporter [Nocardioides mesophilus]
MTTTADDQGYLSHKQILVVMGGLMVGMFLAALDQSIVSTALPRITSELGGLDKLSWVVTAYLLTATSSTPLWGKISDLYGRRLLFQIAIVTFMVGSLLSGLSQNIDQLIVFRAVQGLGGGGLMSLALATIGDIVPPRERGRYQGYFAAVFGTSSVLGPVLGGWFADGPGWEWIFYINLPLGLVALVVTTAALKIPHVRREHSIDYLGAAVVVASVTCFLLYTAWAGPDLGWTSGTGLALLVGGFVLAALFVLVELRATEPIIPMRLFRNSIFSIANVFGFLVGIAMFGSMIFLPVYLQVVDGMSPTKSGLAMLPMVAGIFTTSIGSGILMSRTGRYKPFPMAGALIVAVALVMLSRLDASTPYWFAGLSMYILGLGLGFTLQVLVVIVQNSVDRKDMGVATSSVTFFRQVGGSFGTALFGAILASRLTYHLTQATADLPAGSKPPGNLDSVSQDVQAIQQLPDQLRELVTGAFSAALHDVFLTAVPLVLVAFVVAMFIKEVPLGERTAAGAAEGGPEAQASDGSGVPGSSTAASSADSPTSV